MPPSLRRGFSTAMVPPPQRATRAGYYRGGTSRGIMFREQDLPTDTATRHALFLQAIGTPDPNGRQLDGMGCGISSLSKICVVSPREGDPKADVNYTFVGVGIEEAVVDTAGNCGNMSAAVGPFAFNERLLGDAFAYSGQADGEDVTVRIFNTNTGKYIHSSFPVAHGEAQVEGDLTIDGVASTGARIKLDFLDPAGSKTGKLLPTGNVVDEIDGIQVSCVDAANPGVFVRAEDIGVPGTILPKEFEAQPDKLALLDKLRRRAAVKMGIVSSESEVPRTVPKIAIVSSSSTHTLLSGKTQAASDVDVVIRFISDEQPHRAIPLTGALCTAAAAKVEGSIVHQHLANQPVQKGMVTIGHSSGRIQVDAAMDERGDITSASVFRTARRVMEGSVFWNDKRQ